MGSRSCQMRPNFAKMCRQVGNWLLYLSIRSRGFQCSKLQKAAQNFLFFFFEANIHAATNERHLEVQEESHLWNIILVWETEHSIFCHNKVFVAYIFPFEITCILLNWALGLHLLVVGHSFTSSLMKLCGLELVSYRKSGFSCQLSICVALPEM